MYVTNTIKCLSICALCLSNALQHIDRVSRRWCRSEERSGDRISISLSYYLSITCWRTKIDNLLPAFMTLFAQLSSLSYRFASELSYSLPPCPLFTHRRPRTCQRMCGLRNSFYSRFSHYLTIIRLSVRAHVFVDNVFFATAWSTILGVQV